MVKSRISENQTIEIINDNEYIDLTKENAMQLAVNLLMQVGAIKQVETWKKQILEETEETEKIDE